MSFDKLGDTCFNLASELFQEIARIFEEETGNKPTVEEVCEILLSTLRASSADLFRDTNPMSVTRLTPTIVRKSKVTLKPGDVIAIPRKKGGYYFAVYVGKNFHGLGLAVFRETSRVLQIPDNWKPHLAFWFPLYTELTPMVEGRWLIVGNRPDLTDVLPHGLEVFHKRYEHSSDKIGPYGNAESADKKSRHLTKAEATDMGILDDAWSAVYLTSRMEAFLNKRLG